MQKKEGQTEQFFFSMGCWKRGGKGPKEEDGEESAAFLSRDREDQARNDRARTIKKRSKPSYSGSKEAKRESIRRSFQKNCKKDSTFYQTTRTEKRRR